MLIKDLVEHAAANPFVALVSAIDLRLIQLNQLKKHAPLPTFVHSLVSQLDDFHHLIKTVKDWEIPEPVLRKQVHDAVPGLIASTERAIKAVKDGQMVVATEIMDKARAELIKASGIKDFDSSPTKGHER